jgi:hypothetical protein
MSSSTGKSARTRRRKTPKKKVSEVELGEAMVAFLEASGWDVYQEVTLGDYIADIVVVNGPVVGVIEMKTSMTVHVLGQARRWLPYANMIWVATPKMTNPSHSDSVWLCKAVGVGFFSVKHFSADLGNVVKEEVLPEFYRRTNTATLRALLRPEHKTFAAAGSPNGKVWTPFKETARDLRNLVAGNPGIKLTEALKRIKHHYKKDSTARSCMAKNILRGYVDGVKLRKEGREFKLYPVPTPV